MLPPGTLRRQSFRTPLAVIDDYVGQLPNNQVLVAVRPWPQALYDHRDPRLFRIFVIAYAPQNDSVPSDALGIFITIFRNGYEGRWRLLQATIAPPD